MLCALCTIGAQSQNIGRPERSNPGNLLKNFQTPPKGYGEVPFYWWMGDTLTREHLLGHLEILKNKGIKHGNNLVNVYKGNPKIIRGF